MWTSAYNIPIEYQVHVHVCKLNPNPKPQTLDPKP